MHDPGYHKILDAVGDMYIFVDTDGNLIEMKGSLGFPPDRPAMGCSGTPLAHLFPADRADAVAAMVKDVVATGEEGVLEFSFSPGHASHHFEARFTRLGRDEVLVIIRDLTEVVHSRRSAQALVDASEDMALLLDSRGRILSINRTAASHYGKKPDQMAGTSYWEHLPDEEVKVRRERLEKILDSGAPEKFVDLSGGRIFEVCSNPVRDPAGSIRAAAFFVKDITERVQAEQALIESEARHRRLFEENPMPMYIYDTETMKIIDANRAMIETYGYTLEEMTTMSVGDIRPEEDLQKVIENVSDLRSGQVYHGLWRHLKKDGSIIDVEITSSDFPHSNRPARFVLCNDVTEKLRTERELLVSEDKFRTAFLTSPDSVNINRLEDGMYVDVNDGFTQITGYTRDEAVGKTSGELSIWVDPRQREELVRMLRERGQVENLEARFRIKDGTIREGLMSAKVLQLSGVPHVLSITRDITDLKAAQQALADSENKFRTAFYTSPDPMTISDPETGVLLEVNEGFCNATGYSREEALGRPSADLGIWHVEGQRSEVLRILREEGKVQNMEVDIRIRDGSVRTGLLSASIITVDGRDRLLTISRDIHEIKGAQKALRESEERFRTVFHTNPDSVALCRLSDGRYINVSEGFTRITGYSSGEVIGRTAPDVDIWSDPDDRETFMDRLGRTGLVNNFAADFVRRDGTVVPGLFSASLLELDGEPHLLIILRDVSELKAIQEQLRASLDEKEVLLKEIHHRVKNNLQVISGLLNLQAHHIADPAGQAVYKESQNRVVTMALIHEELYQSVDLSQVHFGDYVRNLCSNLMVSYGVESDRITLHVDTRKVEMVVDTAIPCGLIINELITNALKHAFPGGRRGTISLLFHQHDNGHFHLVIQDDGVGMPEDLDIYSTSSLGMQLVTVLVQQLGGTVELERGAGTRFSIRFSEYHEAGSVLY